MYLQNSSYGNHVVCFTSPSFVVINGLITFTVCARQAIPTSLLFLTKTFNHTATANASLNVYLSSAPLLPTALFGSHTFHSSKQIVGLPSPAATRFSIHARSINPLQISIDLSAANGAVTFS